MRLIFTYIAVLISLGSVAQTSRQLVRAGNDNYKIDSLNSAIEDYEKALSVDPKMEEAKFNLGDAFYRSGKFADAAKTFNELGQTSQNKQIKSDAHFNEGNSLMQTKKFEEAMGAYKNSLRANPSNNKARYNYEFAKKMLQEQQKQEQENENDQNKD
ncbi:MAG: tetratricopeptide repeat protein, partial [Salibacteraceae bacterium]